MDETISTAPFGRGRPVSSRVWVIPLEDPPTHFSVRSGGRGVMGGSVGGSAGSVPPLTESSQALSVGARTVQTHSFPSPFPEHPVVGKVVKSSVAPARFMLELLEGAH